MAVIFSCDENNINPWYNPRRMLQRRLINYLRKSSPRQLQTLFGRPTELQCNGHINTPWQKWGRNYVINPLIPEKCLLRSQIQANTRTSFSHQGQWHITQTEKGDIKKLIGCFALNREIKNTSYYFMLRKLPHKNIKQQILLYTVSTQSMSSRANMWTYFCEPRNWTLH